MLQVDGQVSPANGAGEEEEEERLTMTWLRALWHLKSAAMNRTCAQNLPRILVDKCQTRKSAWWFRSYLDATCEL